MSKRNSNQENTTQRLLALLNLATRPSDELPEAIRKALLSAYLEGYSAGLQDSVASGRRPQS